MDSRPELPPRARRRVRITADSANVYGGESPPARSLSHATLAPLVTDTRKPFGFQYPGFRSPRHGADLEQSRRRTHAGWRAAQVDIDRLDERPGARP